jgi:hypothetical protein
MMRSSRVREITAGSGSVPADKPDPLGEPFYTPQQIAEHLQVSVATARRLFQDESGVIKLGDSNPRGRRGYVTIRIPASVLRRVLREHGR